MPFKARQMEMGGRSRGANVTPLRTTRLKTGSSVKDLKVISPLPAEARGRAHEPAMQQPSSPQQGICLWCALAPAWCGIAMSGIIAMEEDAGEAWAATAHTGPRPPRINPKAIISLMQKEATRRRMTETL